MAGISLATTAGVSAAYLHIINARRSTKTALFAVAGLLFLRLGSVRLSALAGLGRRMPWTFAAFVVAGLGLIGATPTAGFVSKWALMTALIDQGQWPVLVAMLISSLLAVFYIGRIVEVAWFRDPPDGTEPVRAPVSMVAAVWVLVPAVARTSASTPPCRRDLADAAAAALLGLGGG